MWVAHWRFIREPFDEGGGPFVPLPGHEEAVARLLHTIESGGRFAILNAPPGLGKSRVLEQALARARGPLRRIALVKSPLDEDDLMIRLAETLGMRPRRSGNRGEVWRSLAREIRLCSIQGLGVVLAIDGGRDLSRSGGSECLVRLAGLGGTDRGPVTVVLATEADCWETDLDSRFWPLSIRLRPLSFSEAETFLHAKLAAAGCRELVFTHRAVCRLHLLSAGNPRGLERLATLCLMAGASQGREAVSPELVDSVTSEFRSPAMLDSQLI